VLIIGLTGSMGMGKSTVANMLRQHGVAVSDADAIVHQLYEGEAVAAIEDTFPGVAPDGQIDRQKLSQTLADHPQDLAKLEAIVHPLVRDKQRAFLKAQHDAGAAMAVLEIPLLFESGGANRCDVTLVVSAPEHVQRQRILERPNMTDAKLDQLLSRQMPDAEKRDRADLIVDTGTSMEETDQQITHILGDLRQRIGTAFQRHWQ
jgi:dephospho-CoA kinase